MTKGEEGEHDHVNNHLQKCMGSQCLRSGSHVSSPVRKKPRPPFNLGLEICNVSLMIPHSAYIDIDGVFLALIFVVVVTQYSCFSAHCIIFHVQVTGVNGRLMSNLFLLAHNHLSRFSPCFFFFLQYFDPYELNFQY